MSADRQLREELGLGDHANGRANGHAARPEGTAPEHNLTDLGNSGRLVTRHGSDLRYVHPWGRWQVWDGTRWKTDASGEIERRAVETVSSIYGEAAYATDKDERKAIARHAERSESRGRIDAMIALARSRPGVPAMPEELDADPWSLNCSNGTIDLRTGELRPHDRADLITKIAPVEYDPDAQAPRFARFLLEVFGSDEELVAFVRRFAGYSLTGSVEERVFAILHGSGKNGKSTLVELVQAALGDYATTADTETVLAKRHQGVGNDVAALKGARFVSAAEVEQDRRLAESKVKSLTGNDTVTARFLYSEPFTFKPEFKLWLSTNNKPVIRGTDDAIWDRIRLIPFEQRFVGDRRDPKLPEKLREELPGVLAWMVRGCAEWRRDGLGEPAKVAAATEGYRAEQDTLAAFIEDRCVVHPRASAGATPLYNAYKEWCEEGGETRLTQTKFGLQLKERGFRSEKAQRVTWHGIGLRDDRPDPDHRDRRDQADDLDGSVPNPECLGSPKSTEEGSNRLNGDGSDPNCLNGKSRIGMTNTDTASRGLDSRRLLGEENRANQPRKEKLLVKGLQPSNRLNPHTDPTREGRLTTEQEGRISDLRGRGFSEWAARAEVLAKDHPLGCECGVCA